MWLKKTSFLWLVERHMRTWMNEIAKMDLDVLEM